MQRKIQWHLLKEGIFLLIAASLWLLTIYSIREYVSASYLRYFGICLLITVEYFRVVVNEREVPWIRPFAVKVLFGLGNIILFLFVMDSFSILVGQFEDYNWTGAGVQTPDILPGLRAAGYSYLRSATFFSGIAAMLLIILFELRLVYSIFKYREIPGVNK
jgi:hypothetical protein